MIHQRNILRIYYFVAAIAILVLGGVVGSVIVSFLIMVIASIPVIFVIKKIFPAPDWYANEGEKTGVTSMNLSARD